MARLVTSGFELNSLTNSVEFVSSTPSIGSSISSSIVRSGSYSGRQTSLVAGSKSGFNWMFALAGSTGKYFARFYIYIVTLPTESYSSIAVISYNATISFIPETQPCIMLGYDGYLGLTTDAYGNWVASSPAPLELNKWHLVEFMYDGGGAGADAINMKVNGTDCGGTTGLTLATVRCFAVGGNLGGVETNTTGDWYFDDIAVNDDTGSYQTTYPGPGKIIHLKPDATGDNNAWTKNGGGAGDGTNWNLVDEVTPNAGTDYVYANTINTYDHYNVEAGGLTDATHTVKVVSVGMRFANDTADATTAFRVRIKKTSAGTVQESASIIPNSTTYKTNATAEPNIYPLITYLNPDSAAWVSSTIDSMQIGVKLTATGTNNIRVSTIWASVDVSLIEIWAVDSVYIDDTTFGFSEIPNPSTSEAVTVTDSAKYYSDLIYVSETVTMEIFQPAYDISVAEDTPAITVTDTPTVDVQPPDLLVSVTENITVSESVTLQSPPTVVLNTADATDFGNDTTPSLQFTGTDPNSDDIEYNIQISSSLFDTGVVSPGTMADDATVGTVAWTNPDNAKTSNDTYATAVTPGAGAFNTHYLKATNFDFSSIPADATINGILVEIEHKRVDTGYGVSPASDVVVKIVKSDGTIGTTNQADAGTAWPTTDTYKSYGGSSDLWGETWSVADIKDADFGVVLQASINDTVTGRCLNENSLISTSNGDVAIKDLKAGDSVITYNEVTKNTEIKSVTRVWSSLISKSNNRYYYIYVNGEVIEATENHEFYVSGSYVRADELRVGDKLLDIDLEEYPIDNIEIVENTEDSVWDLEVEYNHNFFANNVLVHNLPVGGGGTSNAYVDHVRITVYYSGATFLDKFSVTPDAGFLDYPDVGDTHPFTSATAVTYTVQGGDALTYGTYYWRVAGMDPSGTNSYGEWSSTYSFTVEPDLLISSPADSITVTDTPTLQIDFYITITESTITVSDSGVTITISVASSDSNFFLMFD